MTVIRDPYRRDLDFTLDVSQIAISTLDEKNVDLAYHGFLPDDLDTCEYAFIHFNVKGFQDTHVFLSVNQSSEEERFPVEVSDDEIRDVLMRFFFDEHGHTRTDCGLNDYWLGMWQAHFIEWNARHSR